MNRRIRLLLTALVLVSLAACSGDEELSAGPASAGGSRNVGQAGAQDFALFRAIVERGDVPSPDTLEAVGFFAEHAVDLPPADCGQDLCLHPMLGVAPRFDGRNWTMAYIGMNTAVDPATLPRPPLHLAVALEISEATTSVASALAAGLANVAAALRPEDRMSLVMFSSQADTVLSAVPPDGAVMSDAVHSGLNMGSGPVGLYEGLAGAERALEAATGFTGAQRIVLVTSGRSDNGLLGREQIVNLASGLAKRSVAIGVVGLGEDYDAALPSAIGSLGAGNYSYAVDEDDLQRVFALEAETALFPLATDFRLDITPAEGYRIGRIYGARRAWSTAEQASLSLPALFIGMRDGASSGAGGRRGGGGGLFVELIADGGSGIGADAPAFHMTASWTDSTGDVTLSQPVINTLPPGQNPQSSWAVFSHADYAKPFMMLNMFLALRASVELYDDGDCTHSVGVSDMMEPSIDAWLKAYVDSDIRQDGELLMKLRENMVRACEASGGNVSPQPPQSYDGGCMFI